MFSIEQLAKSLKDVELILNYYAAKHNSDILDKYKHVYKSTVDNEKEPNRKRHFPYASNFVFYISSDTLIYWGFSWCCSHDQKNYNKKVGRNLALLRMAFYPRPYTISNFCSSLRNFQSYYSNAPTIDLFTKKYYPDFVASLSFYKIPTVSIASMVVSDMTNYFGGHGFVQDRWNNYFERSNTEVEQAWINMCNDKWQDKLSSL